MATPLKLLTGSPLGDKNQGYVDRAVTELKQAAAANMLGLSGPALSTWCADHLPRACVVLAVYGLKVVPVSHKTYPDEQVAAWKTLARLNLTEDPPETGPGDLT